MWFKCKQHFILMFCYSKGVVINSVYARNHISLSDIISTMTDNEQTSELEGYITLKNAWLDFMQISFYVINSVYAWNHISLTDVITSMSNNEQTSELERYITQKKYMIWFSYESNLTLKHYIRAHWTRTFFKRVVCIQVGHLQHWHFGLGSHESRRTFWAITCKISSISLSRRILRKYYFFFLLYLSFNFCVY